MNAGPFANAEQFTHDVYFGVFYPSPTDILFAIIDKTRIPPQSTDNSDNGNGSGGNVDGSALAGIVAYEAASTKNLSVEIGGIVILPPFQRTHVTTNAVGLLLQYALDAPVPATKTTTTATTEAEATRVVAGSVSGDCIGFGLGLGRVEWQCNSVNEASKRFAERMGFRFEGVLRGARIFRDGVARGKVGNGRGLCKGAEAGDVGRDSAVYSMCWDDWEGGGREKVRLLMER